MSVAIVSQGLPRQLSALCVPRHCPLLLPSVTTYFHCFLSEVPLVPTFAYSPVSSFRTRRKHLHFSKGCLSRTPQSVCLSFFAITAPTVTSTEKFSTLKAIGITWGPVSRRPGPTGVWVQRSAWALRSFISNKAPEDTMLLGRDPTLRNGLYGLITCLDLPLDGDLLRSGSISYTSHLQGLANVQQSFNQSTNIYWMPSMYQKLL